jgi:hypothetical protein
MGAVVSFVEDTFEAVGDVFEAVGDVVEDVADFVGDVVETVGDVVQAVIDDPLPVLLSVAGSFVGIPPPVTMGALTAARGGDLEDIALSMGTAYFAPSVGNALSSTVSSAFLEAGLNETFTQVASESISKGLVNGTIAEIKGGSFEDGFAGGFTGGMVAGGVGEVASYVKPDVIELAMESGLDLREATSVYNAGTRAFSAGVASEVTGRGDFATSFTNSAIGSGIDSGVRSLNSSIDEQFRTAATDWNEKDQGENPIDVAITGAGIPDEVVSQVEVSESGFDTPPVGASEETSSVLADSQQDSNLASLDSGETSTSEISTLPETQLAEAPQGETVNDFANLYGEQTPESDDTLFANAPSDANIPESVVDIAESLPVDEGPVGPVEPKGALATMAEAPVVDLDANAPAVVSEAPVATDLITSGLAAEKPEGGLNALAPTAETTPEQKMANSLGLKPTDITKPMVATVGNLLKKSLTQQKRPAPRAPMRPAGGLQMAGAKPVQRKAPPPQRMDVANLIPIQKAAPVQQAAPTTRVAPPKTLAGNTKLSPITDIATLTSLVKNKG